MWIINICQVFLEQVILPDAGIKIVVLDYLFDAFPFCFSNEPKIAIKPIIISRLLYLNES